MIPIREPVPAPPGYDQLTHREREALYLLAQGYTAKEAAYLMSISIKTVDQHRLNIYAKLSIHRAVHLTRYAIRAGLIEA